MRRARKLIDVSIPIVGALIVFVAVVLISDVHLQARVLTVLVGVLLIEAGAWNLTDPLLPSERKYMALREEVDGFIDRVRTLNDAAVEARDEETEAAWRAYREAVEELHAAVDRMAEAAGQPEGGEPTVAPPAG